MPANKSPAPPETRLLLTYEEAAQWWSANHYPVTPRGLRRIPLQTQKRGRARFVVFADLKRAASEDFKSVPVVKFREGDGERPHQHDQTH
jgi:hypothetical protein